jgi:hypothetical protein
MVLRGLPLGFISKERIIVTGITWGIYRRHNYLLKGGLMQRISWWANLILLSLSCALLLQPVFGQEPTSSAPSTQEYKASDEKKQELYRIEVEDAIEAGLIEQQLRIKPAIVHGRFFYYYGNEENNELLERYGYEPVRVNREEVLTRVVRVIHKGEEEELSKAGVTVLLRERGYWIVRATLAQLRLLGRLGYEVEGLGRREPRPRQV